ncbi:hypothetical protein ACP70R_026642 [Stipagrostis hirtigluma subsp. patula]
MCASPAPAARERREEKKDDDGGGTWPFFLGFAAMLIVILSIGSQGAGPAYHVAIDAVAGLDPATDLARPTLSPEFNLTVRVDAGPWGGVCLEPGSAVAVSYHRVPLAGVAALPSKVCGTRSVALVATGSGVRVPGADLDALASDLRGFGRGGTAEFEVTLTVPHEGRLMVTSCRARLGDSAALEAPCEVSVVDSVAPAPALPPATG